MKILLVQAQLRSFNRVKDGSVNFTFRTMEEMSNEDFALTDQYYQQNGHLAFKIDEIDMNDIPDGNTNVPGGKSPSVILRNALFAKHMKQGGTKEDFPPYYNKAMAGFTQAVYDSYDT